MKLRLQKQRLRLQKRPRLLPCSRQAFLGLSVLSELLAARTGTNATELIEPQQKQKEQRDDNLSSHKQLVGAGMICLQCYPVGTKS
eukprot:4715087-Amphidinium_carterae.1